MSNLEDLQDKKTAVIIDLFLNTQNNTVPAIANQIGVKQITVHNVINKYLKSKVVNG
jgi:hypothetical protein